MTWRVRPDDPRPPMSSLDAWEFVMDPELRLLPGQRKPAQAEDCGPKNHVWHIYPANPNYSAFCQRCGAKTKAGVKGAERIKSQPLPPHREECEPGRCSPKCKCGPPDIAA